MTVDLEKHYPRLVDLGLVRESYDGELTLDVAGWGDYFGSDLDRSNARVLLANYPDEIGEYGDDHRGHTLYLLSRSVSRETVDAIIGASQYADYALLDDEDHSELEDLMRDEAWADYMLRDVKGDLEAEFKIDDFDETFPDLTDDEIRYAFEETYSDANGGENGYAETATSWVWPSRGVEAAWPAFVDKIIALVLAGLTDPAQGELPV